MRNINFLYEITNYKTGLIPFSPVISSCVASVVQQFKRGKVFVHVGLEAQRPVPQVVSTSVIQEHYLEQKKEKKKQFKSTLNLRSEEWWWSLILLRVTYV